jgi:hypothetical protein
MRPGIAAQEGLSGGVGGSGENLSVLCGIIGAKTTL